MSEYNDLGTDTFNAFQREAPHLLGELFKSLQFSDALGGATGYGTAFVKTENYQGINSTIGKLSPALQDLWRRFKAINAGKDQKFGNMIKKETVTIKKANVGVSLSGRALTSPAAACASASSQPFSLDYKQLAKEVVSQMGSVTAEMSGKMAKEVTARLEKHWGPGNVDGSDDDEPDGSDDEDYDDDEFVPGSGGGGKYYTDKDFAPGSGGGGKFA